MSLRTRPFFVLAVSALASHSMPTFALPVNATLFCSTYPQSGLCQNAQTSCQTCHQGGPPALNPFGLDVLTTMYSRPGYGGKPEDFTKYLSSVLREIGDHDSDGDGVTNGDEIARGFPPGDATQFPSNEDVGPYEPERALRRLMSIYCGVSPTYEQFASLRTSKSPKDVLAQTLHACLQSPYWRTTALPRLADEKIKPVQALGVAGNPFILGDYNYDYRLFVHALTDDRDARDLLLAKYHINEDGSVNNDVIPDTDVPQRSVIGNGQPLAPNRRAGMMTTQWFIVVNTMFAELPRNTAAQAYRSYLGTDIAKSEGLFPVANEPRDVDHMHVTAPACAVCHSHG